MRVMDRLDVLDVVGDLDCERPGLRTERANQLLDLLLGRILVHRYAICELVLKGTSSWLGSGSANLAAGLKP